MPQKIKNTFNLDNTTETDILVEIKKLHPRKAAGDDNIGNKILQICPAVFAYNLSLIYNHHINKGEYPAALKLAKCIPIYKKGEHCLPNNYRPISLLSVFDKILEKLICQTFLEKAFSPLFQSQVILADHSPMFFRFLLTISMMTLRKDRYQPTFTMNEINIHTVSSLSLIFICIYF